MNTRTGVGKVQKCSRQRQKLHSMAKMPLKINIDERQNEVGYGQRIKRRKSTPINSLLTIKNDINDDINESKKDDAKQSPTMTIDSHEQVNNIQLGSGSIHSSTPTKTPLDAYNEDICEDLLQGLCEEDLSISYCNQSGLNHHDDIKLDGLLENALFDTSEISLQDTSKDDGSSTRLLSDPPDSSYPPDSFYGLPLRVLDCFKEYRGILKLYEWQNDCLCLGSVKKGQNLVYSLPTSGGKTLVAEIQILQQLLLKKKDVLFVLPFVSIVQEKVRELLPFAEALDFAIDEYASNRGKIPPRRRLSKKVVYVATIEKANGLVNSLIELNRLDTLGLVVVDEIHMLGEGGKRGATLETCLAKILFASDTIQIIGMSATLTNIKEVATFLKADHYSSDFRPVELREFIKLGRCVYSIEIADDHVNLLPHRDVDSKTESEGDIDQLSCLIKEVVPSSPCLVFCPTRKNCENVAVMLTKCLPRKLKENKATERGQLIHQLSIEAAGLCPVLAKTVPWGIAYHHSGLTADERKLIEEAYLEKTLCVITCTSTLAAGVNLPAKRVILRCPLVGRDFMTRSQYKQMIGRAGRSGLSESGESILIIRPQDKTKVLSCLIQGPCDTCSSSLLSNGIESLMCLLLSLVALKLLTDTQDLISFLKCTLIFQQTDHAQLLSKCNEAMSKLLSSNYITMTTVSGDSKKDSIDITNMGKAIHKGCIDVSIAHDIYNSLQLSLDCLVLSTDLHLLNLVIPHNITDSIQPNWTIYFETITRLQQSETKVVEHLKISVGYISKKATGTSKMLSDNDSLRYTKFYMALILHYLLKYSSAEGVWLVADMFQCSRGFIQNLIQQSTSFASCLIHFTEELPELRPLYLLLPSIALKLSYTVTIHLVPLMEIQGMKQGRARQLYIVGVTAPKDLVTWKAEDLCDQLDHLNLFQARKLIKSAKDLLSERVEILQEEVHELYSTLLPDI